MNRPEATEYADYYANYISKVPGSDVLSVLESQRLQMLQLFAGRSERDGSFRYAPGKWTVKEVLGHITDTERIFAYRALRFARADQTPLPGFEQDRKSTRLNSSHDQISYAVFCLKKKKKKGEQC